MENKIQQFDSENQQISLPFSLSPLVNKKVEVSCTGQDVSTDGGALLLREMDNQISLIILDCDDTNNNIFHL